MRQLPLFGGIFRIGSRHDFVVLILRWRGSPFRGRGAEPGEIFRINDTYNEKAAAWQRQPFAGQQDHNGSIY